MFNVNTCILYKEANSPPFQLLFNVTAGYLESLLIRKLPSHGSCSSTQLNLAQLSSTQLSSAQLNSDRVSSNSAQLNSTQLSSTQLNSAQLATRTQLEHNNCTILLLCSNTTTFFVVVVLLLLLFCSLLFTEPLPPVLQRLACLIAQSQIAGLPVVHNCQRQEVEPHE